MKSILSALLVLLCIGAQAQFGGSVRTPVQPPTLTYRAGNTNALDILLTSSASGPITPASNLTVTAEIRQNEGGKVIASSIFTSGDTATGSFHTTLPALAPFSSYRLGLLIQKAGSYPVRGGVAIINVVDAGSLAKISGVNGLNVTLDFSNRILSVTFDDTPVVANAQFYANQALTYLNQIQSGGGGGGGGGTGTPTNINSYTLAQSLIDNNQNAAIAGKVNTSLYNSFTASITSNVTTRLTQAQADLLYKPLSYVPSWIDVSNKPAFNPAFVGLSNVLNIDATNRANHTGTQSFTTLSGTASPVQLGSGVPLTGKYLDGSGSWLTLPTSGTGGGGTNGTNGVDGKTPTVAIGTVTTGAPGSSATATNSGSTTAVVLNLTIPRGDVGATGQSGTNGTNGTTPTVAIGTVTTGAAGTSASVTNSGSSTAVVLNFSIPRGNTGADGSGGGGATTPANNLTTTTTGTPLDAAQGPVLKALIAAGSRVFNVGEYGSDPTFTTNSKDAFNAAIQACFDAGGGVVYFPKGHYSSAGPVDPQSNAQIYFPLNSYSNPSGLIRIKLVGEIGSNMYSNPFPDGNGNHPAMGGVIIESDLLAAGDVIGTRSENITWGNFNFLHVEIENICVRVRSKTGNTDVAPQATGINMLRMAQYEGRNLEVSTTSNQHQTVQPASTAYGIRMPQTNNFVLSNLTNCFVGYMYVGIDCYEHTRIANTFIDACYAGLRMNTVNHSIDVASICIARCRSNIQAVGGTYFSIQHVSFEDDPTGSYSTWNKTIYDIEELAGAGVGDGTDGIARGFIRYHRVRSGYGPENGNGTDHPFILRNNASNTSIGLLKMWQTGAVSTGGGSTTTTGGSSGTASTSGLLAYWDFEESSGSFLDGSGNSRSLVRNNGVSTSTGKVGNAATFVQASSQYLTGPATGLSADATTGITLAGWFKINAITPQYQVLLGKGDYGSGLREYELYYDKSSGLLTFQTSTSGGATGLNNLSLSYTANGSYVFIAATFDGTTKKFSINNGTPVTASSGALFSGSGTFFMGGEPANPLDGQIDEVGIWNRALTSDEITYLYNSGTGRTKQ